MIDYTINIYTYTIISSDFQLIIRAKLLCQEFMHLIIKKKFLIKIFVANNYILKHAFKLKTTAVFTLFSIFVYFFFLDLS